MAQSKIRAAFIQPMLLAPTESLPDSNEWLYELKLDGYRALGIKAGGNVQLRSRNNNPFNTRYPAVARALAALPDETVVDGEIVALGEHGRPSFNTLQNYGSSPAPLIFYIFDVLILAGRSVMGETLDVRRALLETKVLPGLGEPVRPSVALAATVAELVPILREQGLEGLVAKRRNSIYEPGLRSGAWKKMRLNRSQEFVIAGYTPAGNGIDAVIFGYYEGGRLLYAARTRNGFTSSSRKKLFERLRPLETTVCPFANLPEKTAGRWGQGLTAEKMRECRWLKPELVGRFEFVEWTPDNHLRHSRFMGLREDARAAPLRSATVLP